MIKNKGLGRGLDALLGGDSNSAKGETLTEVDVARIRPGQYQPRTRMDEASLADLAGSIKAQGVIQPILVRRVGSGQVGSGQYEIIAGERRWRAARMAGLTRVPALVRDVPDNTAAAMALIENIQREDLNPLEEAHGIQRLIEEFKMTHEVAAQAVGRSRSAVTNLLRLTQLAKPVQEMLLAGNIEMGHARALLGATATAQVGLAREVVARQLSVREIERRVQALAQTPSLKKKEADPDVARLAEDLSATLGASVSIKPGAKGAGVLCIGYAGLDQLDEIVARLRLRT